MESAIRKSINLGIGGLAFTDHFDVDAPGDNDRFNFDPHKQQGCIDELRNRFPSSEILKGIELGLQAGSLDKAGTLAGSYNFDSIIASIHFVDGEDPYHGDFYSRNSPKDAYIKYILNINKCISDFRNFDILGHFDYIVRYSPYKEKSLTMKDYGDELDAVLKSLAMGGKALEINTNTYRERGGRTPVLDKSVLIRFRELGGEFISMGSDAHDLERIGENFEPFTAFVKNCGFGYITHFKERKNICLKIE
jgi:histidinol-phosphatase (PHP family)